MPEPGKSRPEQPRMTSALIPDIGRVCIAMVQQAQYEATTENEPYLIRGGMMNSDESFSEWLHQEINKTFCLEKEAWAVDRVRRVSDRLQGGLEPSERYIVEIPWIDICTAFTAPGRYIYFCRLLYEKCANDEQV